MSMSFARPRRTLAALAAAALVLGSGAAYADTIHLDTSIGASGPTTITLSGGTASTTMKYFVNTSNACDISATPSVWHVNISGAAGVTASPTDVSFNTCEADKSVTFTATSAGARDVTLSYVSGPTLGPNAQNPSNFTLTVNAPTNTPPHVSVGGVTDGASYEYGTVPAASCSVTDAEDASPSATPSLSTITGLLSSYGLGSQTATCTYADSGGLSDTASATYSIVDTTKPTLNTPGSQSLEATGPGGATATWSDPTGSDNVALEGGSPSCDVTSPHTFDLGVNTVHCSATDVAGNTETGSFTVTVTDTTGPSVTAPSDVTAEATGPTGATVTYSGASASDVHDGALIPACTPTSGSVFALGNTTVTCTATDSSSNTGSADFHVHVVDTTPPKVNVPTDKTVEATSPLGAPATFSVTATDLVDGSTAVSCDHSSGDTFAFGTTTVTCSSTDGHTNTGTSSFTVTVEDTTPPNIASHGDETIEATKASGAVVNYTKPGATDIASTIVTVDCIPDTGSTFGLGTTTVYCTATDEHANESATHFDVTVQDTTPPTVTVPPDETVEATGPDGSPVSFAASASDLVDGSTGVTCDPASGSTLPLGDTTVTCESTDSHSNTGSNSFKVTVQDTTAPTLTLPTSRSASATSAAGAVVSYSATASDLVDGTMTPDCSPVSGSTFVIGTTTVGCTVTDAHHNTATGSFPVTVTVPWNGILQPINANGSSIFKQGSTVPVKFAGFPGLSATLTVTQKDSTPDGTELELVNSNPADSGWVFRYDAVAGQYIYNLGTKNMTSGDWYLHIDLGDHQDHVVKISLKK